MIDVPLYPVSTAEYESTAHYTERLAAPCTPPSRFCWRDLRNGDLVDKFRRALEIIERLMYVVWGGLPVYSEGKQWYQRSNPRCLWGTEQQYEIQTSYGGPRIKRWHETAALGAVEAGVMPNVPVKSRSGDPRRQFQLSEHNEFFPTESLERYCSWPGDLGHSVFDPASSDDDNFRWHDREPVIIRWTQPATVTSIQQDPIIHTSAGDFDMVEVEPGIWEGAIPAQPHDTWIDWYLSVKVNAESETQYDPSPGGSQPEFRGRVDNPESGREPDAAYSFVFFTHYSAYPHGLPELWDLPIQGTNSTDFYQFTPDEEIQPGLINLARFSLEHLAVFFNHSPRDRSEGCCYSSDYNGLGYEDLGDPQMRIKFRWSGTNVPNLHESGGKGGINDVQPLTNHPEEPDPGSESARRSWRGTAMHWRNIDYYGLFPDNWWYGDNESWLPVPNMIVLDEDPLNPPNLAIMRDYGNRGLQYGDAIDIVHIKEIIAAADYLNYHGLWIITPIGTMRRTPTSALGRPCSHVWHDWQNWGGDSGHFEGVIDTGCGHGCCYDCGYTDPANGIGWCDHYPKPTWEECITGHGKCVMRREVTRECDSGGGEWDHNYWDEATCGTMPGYQVVDAGVSELRKFCDLVFGDWAHRVDNRWATGLSYWLAGPRQSINGPDDLHGNTFRKVRRNDNGDVRSYPYSMGNRFGDMESCAEKGPLEPDPPWFERVVGVQTKSLTNNAWLSHNLCPNMESVQRFPSVPTLGHYDYTGNPLTYSFYEIERDCGTDPLGCGWDGAEGCVSHVNASVTASDWPVCMGDAVFVAIDLNHDADGLPTLYNYDLNPDPVPPDDPPCLTHFNLEECI